MKKNIWELIKHVIKTGCLIMFPISRNVTIKHGPVSITFPRLPDLNSQTALILLPWLRGFFYRISRHRISGRMRVTIRKSKYGLIMVIRLPGKKLPFPPHGTVQDCVRILCDWLRFNSDFIH